MWLPPPALLSLCCLLCYWTELDILHWPKRQSTEREGGNESERVRGRGRGGAAVYTRNKKDNTSASNAMSCWPDPNLKSRAAKQEAAAATAVSVAPGCPSIPATLASSVPRLHIHLPSLHSASPRRRNTNEQCESAFVVGLSPYQDSLHESKQGCVYEIIR